ncbi:hypothetical protein ACLQ29_13090 [Micromonospora sp. DT228]|uniref:hypothetical protein n=1 Tax=Micromonospora sp. DT228 TaxID=3393443 RepID=UPI003CF4B9B7
MRNRSGAPLTPTFHHLIEEWERRLELIIEPGDGRAANVDTVAWRLRWTGA